MSNTNPITLNQIEPDKIKIVNQLCDILNLDFSTVFMQSIHIDMSGKEFIVADGNVIIPLEWSSVVQGKFRYFKVVDGSLSEIKKYGPA